jgi:hypothetical protein
MSPVESEHMQRDLHDRRSHPTRLWDVFRWRGRRTRQRRSSEHRRPYFVDRFTLPTFILIMVLIVSTIADGVITWYLLDADCAEANPVMAYLLAKGPGPFFVGKYVLTVAGLPLLLIFKNVYLFRRRFRVGYLIPVLVVLYLALLSYQIYLCSVLLTDV